MTDVQQVESSRAQTKKRDRVRKQSDEALINYDKAVTEGNRDDPPPDAT
jgi:hypothetical protein